MGIKNSISTLLIITFFFCAFSNTEVVASSDQVSSSMEAAEKLFLEKKWQESLVIYKTILPNQKDADLDRVNDRLGDIHFFMGAYQKSSEFYEKVEDSLNGKTVDLLAKMTEAQLAENEAIINGNYNFPNKSNAFRRNLQLVNVLNFIFIKKKYFVDSIPTENENNTTKQQIQNLKEETGKYIFIYHKILTNNGFSLNTSQYNSNLDALKEVINKCDTIVDKLN